MRQGLGMSLNRNASLIGAALVLVLSLAAASFILAFACDCGLLR